jgi:hypothetical protein
MNVVEFDDRLTNNMAQRAMGVAAYGTVRMLIHHLELTGVLTADQTNTLIQMNATSCQQMSMDQEKVGKRNEARLWGLASEFVRNLTPKR